MLVVEVYPFWAGAAYSRRARGRLPAPWPLLPRS